MIYFQPVRTARFTFTLKELTIGNVRELLNIPSHLLESARSTFLRLALKDLVWHQGYENCTLEHLTAQERLFIESTYLSSVSDVPDFEVGNGHYTNYLQVEKQYKHKEIEVGKMIDDEDVWFMQPLTSAMLETIEERLFMHDSVSRADWFFYAMAAQLFRKEEDIVSPYLNAVSYGDWLDERVGKLQALPESQFASLLSLFINQGMKGLNHLFDLNFDSSGIVVLPLDSTTRNPKGEEVELLPARFRSTHAISTPSKLLFGKFE